MSELRDNLPFTVVDYKDAGGDYLAARFGVKQADMHPTAERMADSDVTLAEMAFAFGARESLRRKMNMSRVQAISAGFSTSDFSTVLADSIRKLVAVEYDANADHRRIAAPVEAKNFHEISFPLFDLDASLPEILENSQFRNTVSVGTSGGESAAVLSYGALIGISRKVVINDDSQLIETVFRQLAASAARFEAETVFGVLEANPTLSDGSPMFGASNSVTGALTQSTLGSAFAALRRQTGASGAVTNNRPAFLLVPPEKEVAALALMAALSSNRPPVEVIATPWIVSTDWYALASPARSPVLGLLRLAGATRAVRVEAGRASVRTDTLPIKCATDFGATALSRVGAVKGSE